MYNRYIPPEEDSWAPVQETPPPTQRPERPGRKAPPLAELLGGKGSLTGLLSGGEGAGLSGLLKSLHLENLDSGDVLLLLIMLYLLVEGDELELVIALGLTLIMGLGEEKNT